MVKASISYTKYDRNTRYNNAGRDVNKQFAEIPGKNCPRINPTIGTIAPQLFASVVCLFYVLTVTGGQSNHQSRKEDGCF
jgi:hypothetical protein